MAVYRVYSIAGIIYYMLVYYMVANTLILPLPLQPHTPKYYLGVEEVSESHSLWVPQLEVVDWEMSQEELNCWDEENVLEG